MRVTKSIVVAQTGVGKPDYSKEVSSALERRGLRLGYNQTLKIFGLVFSDDNTGVHTAAISATVMTDGTAAFTVNLLVGLAIVNVTDGSYGIIIANGVTTVTVAALIGGATNQWNPGDVYMVVSPYSWVTTPLAVGTSAHLVDNETGLASPFTVPQGYILSMIEGAHSSHGDIEVWAYAEGFVYSGGGIVSGGSTFFENRIVGFTTAVLDPTGLTSHTIDVTVKNVGLGTLTGGFNLIGVLEAVGTPPPPTTKTVRCKFCGHEETVPQETTNWICPECGQLNKYLTLSKFRGTV